MVATMIFDMDGDEPFQVGGIEVAAIPLVTSVVMKSVQLGKSVNGFFIRKSRKKRGLLNMVEGIINDERIVLVDDIINSGSSFIRQVEVMESLGKKVDSIITILRFRDESYYEELRARGIKILSIFCLDDFKKTLHIQNFNKEISLPTPYPYKAKWYFKSEEAHLEHVVPKSKPVLSDGVLYFGSDSGNFWAIDAETGAAKWSHKVLFGSQGKLIFSSPAVYMDTVFFGAYDGNFYALDKNTGKKKWVAWHADWVGSSPCVAHDLGLVYVGMEFGFWKFKGGVAAYDVHTGKRIWQSDSSEYTHGSPTYSIKNKVVVCGSNDGIVYGLHARTGKVLWTYKAGGEVKAGCALSSSEKYVAFGSFNNEFVVLETKTGKKVCVFETMEANYSTPAWQGDEAIICSSLDKRIYKFNVKTGNKGWEYLTTARVFASPLIDDGKVYCGNNSSRLYVLDLKTGLEVALFQATERITNQVVIDNKPQVIYLTTFANEIIALVPKTDP
jgi:outer membrane protein assembly factor BamB/orotate phosphoribosyltransferase